MIILDGWGIGPKNKHNAIWRAKTPTMDRLWKDYPHSTLAASGPAVGLLKGQIGSSEVGHMHIGAGRVVEQELTRLHRSLRDGTFFRNPALLAAFRVAKKKRSRVHLIGLTSDGGVHAHQDHLVALLKMAHRQHCSKVFVHAILDGRDSPPASAKQYLLRIQQAMEQWNTGTIASLCGRFWAMDRDNNHTYTKRAVALLTRSKGTFHASATAAIKESYRRKIYDEFIEPIVIDPSGRIQSGDSVIFFNFRADRMRQLVKVLSQTVRGVHITTMIPYGVDEAKTNIAFDRVTPINHFSQVISRHGIGQLKIAESEKYAHVTYFFNGTQEKPYPAERRVLIPSPDVPTYDLFPAMSAPKIADTLLRNLKKFPVIVVNFANADMVGHSADMKATIEACTTLDAMIGRIVEAAELTGHMVMITGDHGNAEQLYDDALKSRHTAHTTNPVPFILVTKQHIRLRAKGSLTNIAPLALELLGLPVPKEMGASLQIL